MNSIKVGVIGQGYVGLNLAIHASKSFEVLGFDRNCELVTNINRGISHIEGVTSDSINIALETQKFRATCDSSDLADRDILVIAVPTPLTEVKKPDLSYVISACEIIADNAKSGSLIINESTSYPGTLRNLIAPLIRSRSKFGNTLLFAASPERVDPGRDDFTTKNTPRLISGLNKESIEKASDFYRSFCDLLVHTKTPEIAEMAKIFENTFRQVNIGLVNEFAMVCSELKIDVYDVLDAASTKPFGFMKFTPGPGVGGHCIPVDPIYLKEMANESGIQTNFIDLADKINKEMPERIINKIEENVNLTGKKILIIGVAYKPNVSDVRETPALEFIKILRQKECLVKWHDSQVSNWENETSSAIGEADIYIVLVRHSDLDVEKLRATNKFIFDCTGSIPGVSRL